SAPLFPRLVWQDAGLPVPLAATPVFRLLDFVRPAADPFAPVAWWRKDKPASGSTPPKKTMARGVFAKCDGCSELVLADDPEANLRVWPKCDHPFALPPPERIALVCDEGWFPEHDVELEPGDPLGFRDSKRYRDRARAAHRTAGVREAYRWGQARVAGQPVA